MKESLYKILGRERLGLRRYGRYIVEFSTTWPSTAKTLYLVSEFTSWHPGRIKLRKTGGRGLALIKIWDGIYHYVFAENGYNYYIDKENPVILEKFKPFPEVKKEFTVSVADIGVSTISELLEKGGLHLEHVVHDERDPMFLSRYLGYIVVRLRTLRNEVDEVLLKIVCEGSVKTASMDKILATRYYDYYEAIIKCGDPSGYMFVLNVDGRNIPYGSEGAVENPSYIIPVTVSGTDNALWYLGAVYYSIFVDSFARSKYHVEPPKTIREYAPRERGYYGGNLKGIIDRIQYLEELGIDAIYLTPIFGSTTYHRYDTVDYYEIDKYLGDINLFKELLEKLHEKNIKIILDIPVHHTSYCFHAFKDVLEKGRKSHYWNWYIFLKELDEVPRKILEKLLNIVKSSKCSCEKSKRLRKTTPFYETFYGVWCMPKLNYDNAEVVGFMKNVLTYWSNIGVDGFRLDVSLGVPDNAMRAIYRTAKKNAKLVIGEVMTDPKYYLWEDLYDSAMNYKLRRLILDFFYYRKLSAGDFAKQVMEQYVHLPPYKANALYNLLGSHDTIRIRLLVRDKKTLKQIYAFLFAVYGSPSIYYGDEIGLEGGEDPDNRRPMPWDSSLWDKELLEHIRKLIKLRRSSRELRYGFFKIYNIGENIAVERSLGGSKIIVLFNTSDYTVQHSVKNGNRILYGIYYNIINGNVLELYSKGAVFIYKIID